MRAISTLQIWESVGDRCPSRSFSAVSFEFGMAMALASGLPYLLIEDEIVSNIDSW